MPESYCKLMFGNCSDSLWEDKLKYASVEGNKQASMKFMVSVE